MQKKGDSARIKDNSCCVSMESRHAFKRPSWETGFGDFAVTTITRVNMYRWLSHARHYPKKFK